MQSRRAILIAGVLFGGHDAAAHDWYPRECCGGSECAAIVSTVRLQDGSLLIENGNGDRAIFPAGFLVRPSPDHRGHACITKYIMRPQCLFFPAGG